MRTKLTRRSILKGAAGLALGSIGFRMPVLAADEELVEFSDLAGFKSENHTELPRVRFFDLRRLTSFQTPQDEFFIFHQTKAVDVDPAAFRLRIGGFVERPAEFNLDQIRRRPDRRDLAVTLECSGNTAQGAANGQVSNGVWSGVGLGSILAECGVKPEAREVAFFGLDMERYGNDPVPSPHGRSLYVQDAISPDPMLAFALNGQPLSTEHGFPLRLIVPGWYGMTQIKWLARIEVLDRRFEGTHMARNYHTIREGADMMLESSISKTRLKSVVARVTRRKLESGSFAYRISGAAWGGQQAIDRVEVQIDGGEWRRAAFSERNGNFAWILWSLEWDDARAGAHTIVARAIDSQGNIQPTREDWQKGMRTLREDNSQWPRRINIR